LERNVITQLPEQATMSGGNISSRKKLKVFMSRQCATQQIFSLERHFMLLLFYLLRYPVCFLGVVVHTLWPVWDKEN